MPDEEKKTQEKIRKKERPRMTVKADIGGPGRRLNAASAKAPLVALDLVQIPR